MSHLHDLLRNGANVVVWPGGLDEANSVESQDAVSLKTRTGFIRLAVKHGVAVLPVFVFGELDAVEAVRLLPKPLATWLKKTFRVSSNGFVGRYKSFIPRRVPFNMVVGKPIPTQAAFAAHDDVPAGVRDAEVARVHAAYKAELRRIYQENAAKFGYEGRELVLACERAEERRQAKKGKAE